MDAATPPVAATKPTTGIGLTVATLEGTVDPEGGNVNVTTSSGGLLTLLP